jgi:hypothetical protein
MRSFGIKSFELEQSAEKSEIPDKDLSRIRGSLSELANKETDLQLRLSSQKTC